MVNREPHRETPGDSDTKPVVLDSPDVSVQQSNDQHSIIPTARMGGARAGHTTTLLKNGHVLICGGFVSDNTLRSAEIYDPGSKTFKPAGNMTVARASHSSTVLPDGKVLITGGYNGTYLSSTEVFDPETKAFTSAGPMTTPRSGHSATILDNGKILFTGGVSTGWSFLESAELYDIPLRTFSATGHMSTARESHTATKLKKGTVLITGGHKGRRADIIIYKSAEIYNPSTGNFSPSGSMTKIHHKHDAVLLGDGRVLITGGSDERDGNGAYRSSEIYDPASSTFTTSGRMNFTRYKHTGTSLLLENGDVFIGGGANQAEIYNPKTYAFAIVTGSFKTHRLFSCATLLANGNVLISGGYDENQKTSADAWVYNRE